MKFDCRVARAFMVPRVSDFSFTGATEIYCQQRIMDDIMEKIYDSSCHKLVMQNLRCVMVRLFQLFVMS